MLARNCDFARSACTAAARASSASARALALAQEPLHLAPRLHLLGHVVAVRRDPGPGAVRFHERLVDEVDEALLRLAARRAHEQHGHLTADDGLAGGQHLIEQGEESLVAHLGECISDGQADQVAMADELVVAVVGELEDVMPAAEDGEEGGRLLEDGGEPRALDLQLVD